MEKLKVGDVVRLTCPDYISMTVEYVDADNLISCVWYDMDWHLKRDKIYIDCLEKIK